MDYGRFCYVKEFIDSIVQYRFQNNIIEFNEEDILDFMNNFVSTHKAIIMANWFKN